jgi:hypothetical protein
MPMNNQAYFFIQQFNDIYEKVRRDTEKLLNRKIERCKG